MFSFLASFDRRRRGARRSGSGWVGVHASERALLAAAAVPGAGARPAVRLLSPQAVPARPSALRGWRNALGQRMRANIVLRMADYRVLPIEPPALPADELREAARWQIADVLDFAAEDAAIDVLELPSHGGARRQQRFVVAAPPDSVARWVAICKEAELPLAAVDIPEMAIRNLSVLAAGDAAHAFLYLGLRSTRLVLIWKRELCSFRQLDFSAPALAALPADEHAAALERLALEIQRTADSFSRQFSGVELEALWLRATAEPERLADALSVLISQRVRPYALEQYVDVLPGEPVLDVVLGRDHLLAIGGALREEAV